MGLSRLLLGQAAGTSLGLQLFMWGVSTVLKTERYYDLTGAMTYLLITAFSAYLSPAFPNFTTSQHLICVMQAVWAGRLGAFLFYRFTKVGADSRFNKVRDQPFQFLIYWVVQAVWIFLCCLPMLVLLSQQPSRRASLAPMSFSQYLGLAMFATGFLIEAIADQQKLNFKLNTRNRDQFIRSGLWSFVRFPNYAGEILLQLGMALFSFSSVGFFPMEYVESDSTVPIHAFGESTSDWLGWSARLLPFLTPIFVSWLLLRVSGIPLQEKQAFKRWGKVDPPSSLLY
jgi:steroid 5-alpha reductase family enzyme